MVLRFVAAGLQRQVAAVVPTVAVAALLVTSIHSIGLVPQRFAEQHGQALGVRPFPVPEALAEIVEIMKPVARASHTPRVRWSRLTGPWVSHRPRAGRRSAENRRRLA